MSNYELNFNKNLGALEEYNPELAQRIESIKTNDRFEVFAGKNVFDTNIYDHVLNEKLYENAEEFFNTKYSEIYNKFERYPVLFFYGLGNGILYKALLKNENHRSIIVFEENLELVYIAFHLIDFSEELREKRLFVLDFFDNTALGLLLGTELDYRFYLKDNALIVHSPYYESNTQIIFIQEQLSKLCNNLIAELGNDINDSLQGMKQILANLNFQLKNPSLKDLLDTRKDKNKNAIIVSTGPSLIKQLPLLKQIQNKASIFCADSAYAILAKHDIKPDYVLMLERSDLTAKFFDNDFKDFNKDILFILTSVVHKNTLEFLEKNNRKFIIIHRPLPFAKALNMDDYGYLSNGMSVANMAYDLALKLKHKNIILIGQDLAYGEDGNSHPQDYLHKADFENSRKNNIFVKAYGGNGEVESNAFWILFKESFERDIFQAKNLATTYNATEGGARIEGAIEKPFKELCEELLKDEKSLTQIQNSNKKSLSEIKNTLISLNKTAKEKFNKFSLFEKELKKINSYIKKTKLLANLDFAKILKINDKLHKIKLDLENMQEFGEMLNPALKNIEFKLAKITTQSAISQDEKKQRMISWLKAHEEWFEVLIKNMKIQIDTIDEFLKS